MKELIYNEIISNSGKITFKNLYSKFNVGKEELQKILLDLKLDGRILQTNNKYGIFPKDLKIGSVVVSSSGRKYLYYQKEKISIASEYTYGLFLNDTVTFKLNDNYEAEIYNIVDRKLGKMTCEIKIIDGKKTIIPFNKDIKVKLPSNIMDNLFDGDIILVNITPDNLYNECEYLETIGRIDDPLIDDKAIALNYGFDNDYDKEYLSEVEKMPTYIDEEDTINREDYRNLTSFTIDGANTKDMDDGLSCEMMSDGTIRVYVHIADVSHYIKPGSRIFDRACEKTTSLYLNNSVFHMLHHIISNGICSLNELSDRLTKTVIMDIDKNGNIINFDIVKSVINSDKKMTYEDVDKIIMHNDMVPGYEKFEKDIYILYDAAVRLEKRFVEANGKLNFANTELSITYNDDGTIKSVANKENSISRKIIENLMIAANECVANWFINIDMPTVYRIHEFPDINKINRTIEELNKSGFNIKPIRDIDNPKSLQRILNTLSTYEEYPVISQMLVMAMQRARYSIENLGHYALGLPAYLHFTSPIRRLPDLLVHTIIDLIFLKPEKLTVEFLSELEDILKDLCIKSSRMERQADMAERIAERRQILNMLKRSNIKEFEATIAEIGNKVKIKLEGIDTFIDSKELNKVFGYDSKRKRYYDRDTGMHIKIGTPVLVRLLSIDSINDNFSVKVLGIVNNNSKKKILQK